MQQVNHIINEIKNLSQEDVQLLFNMLGVSQELETKQVVFSNVPVYCPYCEAIKFHKHDKRNNKQRYKCQICSKTFTGTTRTALNSVHQSHYDKFVEFIKCMVNNLSLTRIAEIVGIILKSAFSWRHKVLDVLSRNMTGDTISGTIEMDEAYFKQSFKGNHYKSIGRKPHKHGYTPGFEDKQGLSKDKVCVSTAIDRDKHVVVERLGYGRPSSESITNHYNGKIKHIENSLLIADGEKSYIGFAEEIGIEFKRLAKPKGYSKYNRLPIIINNQGKWKQVSHPKCK